MVTEHRMTGLFRMVLIAALSACVLAGCIPLAATGVVVAAMVATDRRTVGAQTDDTAIELKAIADIEKQFGGSRGISVTSYNRIVMLTGQVANESLRRRAAEIVARIDNVREPVQNELAIASSASFSTGASDAAISTKVKAAFVDARDVQSSAIKVVTEAGVVYLMGIVTRAEGERAAQVASRVSGVKRVVTVFEYVTPDELARIERMNSSPQQAPGR